YCVAPLTAIWLGRLSWAHAQQTPRTAARCCPALPGGHARFFRRKKRHQARRDRGTPTSRPPRISAARGKEASTVRGEGDVPADEGSRVMVDADDDRKLLRKLITQGGSKY